MLETPDYNTNYPTLSVFTTVRKYFTLNESTQRLRETGHDGCKGNPKFTVYFEQMSRVEGLGRQAETLQTDPAKLRKLHLFIFYFFV